MSKETILQKLRNPTLKDLNDKRLRKIAEEKGVSLRGKMTKENIINRLKNPIPHYTIESLKKVAVNNNIEVGRNIKKPDLINILQNANLIPTTTPGTEVVVDSNIGVRFSDAPLALIKSIKRETTNALEDLKNYRKYIKNSKVEFITSTRLKQIQKTLEENEKRAKEEHDRLFEAKETVSALRYFSRVYTINGIEDYDAKSFLNDAEGSITKVLRENKQTKFKLIFKCNMIREKDGEIIIRPFVFHSENMTNLEGTDENELYNIMIDMVEEGIQKLENAPGTGWHFHSVINLELHTVEWVP